MTKKSSPCKGFTLMEVLVAVAVIAVLIAIIIPIAHIAVEKAQKATCAANCRALKGLLTSEYLLGELTAEEINAISLEDGNDYLFQNESFPCVTGGVITANFNSGAILVHCSYHDDGSSGGSDSVPPLTNEAAKKVWNVVDTYSPDIDSTAVDGKNRNALIAALAKDGISLSDIGAVSWRYSSDHYGRLFQWTTTDISTLKEGDPVTIIRYRLDGTAFPGIYSVWGGKVVTRNGILTIEALSGNESEYTRGLPLADKKDFENIIPYYNDNAEGNPPLD